MIINADILRRETLQLIKQIDAQIEQVNSEARKVGLLPEHLRDKNGSWAMSPLLLAKVQAYATLVQLQSKR